MLEYETRPATAKDIDRLEIIYRQNMKPLVTENQHWNDKLFRQNYEADFIQILLVKGEVAGFYKVLKQGAAHYLAEIQIAFNYQNGKIGSDVLQKQIKLANALNKELKLRVLKSNQAINLYKRMGFRVIKEDELAVVMAFTKEYSE